MLPDFVSYVIVAMGLIGIGLGVFKTARPLLANWRGLFPSAEHEQDLRAMEEALAGIYRGNRNNDDYQTFRSYFSNSRDEQGESLFDDEEDEQFTGTGDYDANPTPASLASRYGARTVSVRDADTEAIPRVVQMTAPVAGVEMGEREAEEDDTLGDLLADEETRGAGASEGDDLDDDLRSLFEEEQETHALPEAIRNAVPLVTIDALIAEAREVYGLIGTSTDESPA